MKASSTNNEVVVKLSRRKLLALLYMLDAKDKAIPALSSRYDNIEILVMPEEDHIHYKDRLAGSMSWENK